MLAPRRFKFAIFFFGVIFSASDAVCQEKKLLGRVVDGQTQKPLKNVNIIILGTTSGTISNHLGFFELTIDPSKHSMLIASHVGFATAEVPLSNADKFKFSLTRVYQPLADIVLADHPKQYRAVEPAKAPSGFGTDGMGVVESGAVFPGGMNNFSAFVGNNLAAESAAMQSNEVIVLFTVDATGKAINFIFPDSTNTFNPRVVAALEAMPVWTPATQRQVSVPQDFLLKIIRKRADLKPFTDFVGSKIKYPADARRVGIEGIVMVEFNVDPSGTISDFNKVADIGGGCGDEVVRVLESTPATIAQILPNGTGRKGYLLPVYFGLDNPLAGPVPAAHNPDLFIFQPLYITAVGIEREIKVTGTGSSYPVGIEQTRTSGPGKITIKGAVGVPMSLKAALADKKGTERLQLVDQGLETFPPDILKLTNLKVLDIEKNFLTTLPEEIVTLRKLEELYLFQNMLTLLPKSLAQMTELKTLGAAENQLTSFSEITSLHSLQGLDLSGNQITRLPFGINDMQGLKILLLRGNQITHISDQLFELRGLRTLDISGNPMDSSEFNRVRAAMPFTDVITSIPTWQPSDPDGDYLFTIVEVSAAPKGGMGEFYKHVMNEMKYPPQARRMGIDGKVFVEFVVNKDGSISDVRVVKGIGGGCDEEAVRVVEKAPGWIPGTQRGQPVRQKMVMPITFKLG